MNLTTDQARKPRDLDQVAPGPVPRYRNLLNRFGAAFGIAVLVGAAFLDLTARAGQGTNVTATVPDAAPAVPAPAQPQDPPVEPPAVEDSQGSTAGALLGLYVVDSLEVHQLEETYAEATQIDESHVAQMSSALAALDTVEWPAELSEVVAGLSGHSLAIETRS
ncbi:MAG TPA: hypothetical protein VEB69_11470 [Acidimicrobiia bacterium]|nr:hypothetical protein [Acidimicrobiia bacterium]